MGLFSVSRNMGSVQPVRLGGLMPSVTVLKFLIIFLKRFPLFHLALGPAYDELVERNDFGCDTVGRVKPTLDPGPHDLVPDLEGCVE